MPHGKPKPPPRTRNKKTNAASGAFAYREIAPKLAELTDELLFGDIWKRDELSPRDRSLITVAALTAQYRNEQLGYHLAKAIENGVTKLELVELITHVAFYAGWPASMSAIRLAAQLFEE